MNSFQPVKFVLQSIRGFSKLEIFKMMVTLTSGFCALRLIFFLIICRAMHFAKGSIGYKSIIDAQFKSTIRCVYLQMIDHSLILSSYFYTKCTYSMKFRTNCTYSSFLLRNTSKFLIIRPFQLARISFFFSCL